MTATKSTQSIAKDLEELEAIAAWFESSEHVDVEKGLEKVKRGAELAARLKARLKEVENEFAVVRGED